jgi:hypothetical protein
MEEVVPSMSVKIRVFIRAILPPNEGMAGFVPNAICGLGRIHGSSDDLRRMRQRGATGGAAPLAAIRTPNR